MITWECSIGVMGEKRGWMESGGEVQGLRKTERQVQINTRGGLTQDPRTLRQLEKQSMQVREPGSGTCMPLQSACVYVCAYSIHIVQCVMVILIKQSVGMIS